MIGLKNKIIEVINPFIEPLYKEPPSFYNRRPKWYIKDDFGNPVYNVEDELRFQNYGIWANIPEEEIPRYLLIKNRDGSWRPTNEAIRGQMYAKASDPASILSREFRNKQSFKDSDVFGTIGGEHSNYIYLGENLDGTLNYVLEDLQTLNPQWLITHPIKRLFPKGSKLYDFLHTLGMKHIGKHFGFGEHKIRLGLKITPDGGRTLQTFDPSDFTQAAGQAVHFQNAYVTKSNNVNPND